MIAAGFGDRDHLEDTAMRMQNLVTLVTGGGRGIGAAVATAFADAGARVFIVARTQSELEKTTAEIRAKGGQCTPLFADVGSFPDCKRAVDLILARHGRIDVLVNNAAMLGTRETIAITDPDVWTQVQNVNVNGTFFMIRLVLPIMLAQKSGSIINTSSGVGRRGRAGWGAYAASKFAIEGLSQTLADELEGTGVRVNVINPGPTATTMRARAYPDEDPSRHPTPEQITGAYLHFGSGDSKHENGRSVDARDWL